MRQTRDIDRRAINSLRRLTLYSYRDVYEKANDLYYSGIAGAETQPYSVVRHAIGMGSHLGWVSYRCIIGYWPFCKR